MHTRACHVGDCVDVTENIVLITIDCLRADHLESYGYPRVTSPNLTRLAREGVVFRNVVSDGPFTLASFPSMMTSSHPLEGDIYYSLRGRPPLISEVLKGEGFETAAFNPNILLTLRSDFTKGFNHYEGYVARASDEFTIAVTGGSVRSKTDKIKSKIRNLVLSLSSRFPVIGSLAYIVDRLGKEFPTETAERVTSDAIDWILKNRDRPFFVWIHYMDVHEPYFLEKIAMKRHYSSWAGLLSEMKASHLFNKMVLGGKILSDREESYLRKFLVDVYDDRIRHVDAQVGRLISTLEKANLSRETAIIVTSDHGQAFLEHGNIFHKASFYEENLRIPLIVWSGNEWSGRINANSPVSLVDLPPTILSILGLPAHPEYRGKDITAPLKRDHVISEASYDEHGLPFYKVPRSTELNFSFAIYRGRYKYIKHFPMKSSKRAELYDLSADPNERRNLVGELPDLAAEFEKILEKHFDDIGLNIGREIVKFKIHLRKVLGGDG